MERELPRATSELARVQRRVDQLKMGIEEAKAEEKRAGLQLHTAVVSETKAKSESRVSRSYTSHSKLIGGKQHVHGQPKLLDSTNTMTKLAGGAYNTVAGASSFHPKPVQSTNRVSGNSLGTNHDYSHRLAKLRAQMEDLGVSRR